MVGRCCCNGEEVYWLGKDCNMAGQGRMNGLLKILGFNLSLGVSVTSKETFDSTTTTT